MSKYLAALKEKDFERMNTTALQELQKEPSCTFCSEQVLTTQKYPTPEQAAELRDLVAVILADDTKAGRDEALAVALADVDNALICYRMLAKEMLP